MRTKVGITIVACTLLVAAAGCPPANRPTPEPAGSAIKLPPEVAGTWKAKGSPWKIVLSPDGTVSSAVIPMGQVEVKPNQTTKMEMKDDSISTYEAGDFIVEYTPETRELFVAIEMKKIHIVFRENVIDGNTTDRFVGRVSEDGKVWTTDWIQVFDYGPRFPQDPNDVEATLLMFEKVEP